MILLTFSVYDKLLDGLLVNCFSALVTRNDVDTKVARRYLKDIPPRVDLGNLEKKK